MDGTYHSPRPELLPFLPASALRVLDVGSGDGAFGASMLAKNPNLTLVGIEPDADSVDRARSRGYAVVHHGTLEAVVGQIEGVFDVIWCNDVLEHMAQPSHALELLRPLLANAGTLIASIPNVRHMSVWLPLIRRGEWHYTDIGILDSTHVRFFTRASMQDLFEASGWEVINVSGINRSRWGDVVMDTWKVRLLQRALGKTGDEFVYTQFVLQARPAN